jgi:hypothetical protein
MSLTEDEISAASDILARADTAERQHLAFMLAMAEAERWRAGGGGDGGGVDRLHAPREFGSS